jgi:hypothetical protein
VHLFVVTTVTGIVVIHAVGTITAVTLLTKEFVVMMGGLAAVVVATTIHVHGVVWLHYVRALHQNNFK